MATLSELARYLDDTLDIATIPDYPNAVNGVQLANHGNITHVAVAVDFCSDTVNGAINCGAGLLVVHHGMFWGGVEPITGHRHQRLWALLTHDVAVYSAHLPLDIHREIGNNALLSKLLGLTPSCGFGRYQTIDVGLSGDSEIPTRYIVDRAEALATTYRGNFIATQFNDDRVTRRWAVCTGSGADSAALRLATQRGIDTLIVGEGPHHTAVEARELGIVVIYAGHYATETLGVRALGERLTGQFGIPSTFIDAPSGL